MSNNLGSNGFVVVRKVGIVCTLQMFHMAGGLPEAQETQARALAIRAAAAEEAKTTKVKAKAKPKAKPKLQAKPKNTLKAGANSSTNGGANRKAEAADLNILMLELETAQGDA